MKDSIYVLIAVVCMSVGAVALGLSFTSLGNYALVASMILGVAAVTLINLQQKKKNFKQLLYFKIAAYVIFAAALALFAVGAINR